MRASDLNWLAGLLEGEGCFHRTYDSRLQVRLKMVDKDVVKRAANLMGHRRIRQYTDKRHATWKPLWLLTVTGQDAGKWMLRLYGLMGKRRQKQIRKCLS